MTEKNPFENVFHRIDELLKIVNEAQNIPFSQEMPDEVEELLQLVEKDVSLFSKISEEAFIKAGLTPQEIQQLSNQTPKNASAKLKKSFEFAEKLKVELQRKQLAFSQAKARKKIGINEKDPLKSALKRKKRFKGAGGDRNWIPLR